MIYSDTDFSNKLNNIYIGFDLIYTRELISRTPTGQDIDASVETVRGKLKSLNFQAKRGILLKLVDKVTSD